MLLFAFSAQDQVEKYGAYVGIAAFLGLAVLSLLYFSQARELKRLREWAGRAPERARELEHRVVAQATATVARRAPGAPSQAQTSGGAIAPPRRLAEMPATPAPQTPAAAGQATQLAEAVEADPATNGTVSPPPRGPGGSVPAGGLPVPVNGKGDAPHVASPEGEEAPVSRNGDGAPAAEPAESAAEPAESAAEPAPAPARAAADAPAEREPEPVAAAPTVPGEIPAASPVPRATPAQRVGVEPRPAAPLRQAKPSATPRPAAAAGGGGRRPAPPAARRGAAARPPREGRSAGSIALLVGVVVLVLGGGTYLGTVVFGGDDAQPPPNESAPPPTQTEDGTGGTGGGGGQASPPAETNVAVLNGTTSSGLAGALADQLTGEGYVRGVVETNSDQTVQDSIVFYAEGERATARAVGEVLGIETAEPLDAERQALAPEADVLVLAGADQAP